MTREEAVLILDPDNSEAALARLEYYAGFGGEEAELRIIFGLWEGGAERWPIMSILLVINAVMRVWPGATTLCL